MLVDEKVVFAINETLTVLAQISAYTMLPTLAVGIVIAIFQAATQINEQSLSFIPKLVLLFFIIMYFGAGLIEKIGQLALKTIQSIPMII